MYLFSVIYNIVVIIAIIFVLYYRYLLGLQKKDLPHFNKMIIVLAILLGIGVTLFILARNGFI